MLIDIDDGRPTEGEHIIGDLVERATLVALVRHSLSPLCAISKPTKSTAVIRDACSNTFGSLWATFLPRYCLNVTVESRRRSNFREVLTACIGRSHGSGRWARGGITE